MSQVENIPRPFIMAVTVDISHPMGGIMEAILNLFVVD